MREPLQLLLWCKGLLWVQSDAGHPLRNLLLITLEKTLNHVGKDLDALCPCQTRILVAIGNSMKIPAPSLTIVKSAAPGTCFALFGAGLVVAMLVTGNPELALRSAERATRPDGGAHETVQVTQLKGGPGDSGSAAAFGALVEFGASREQAGDRAGAIAAYAQALSKGDVPLSAAALPLHRVAALYHAEGRHEEALPLARLAVSLTGDDPDLLHLLARILEARGETGEALVAARAAVELSPERADFQATVAQLRQAELARSE